MNLIQNNPYSMNLIQNKPCSYKPYSNRTCVRTMRECRAASNSLSDCEIYQNKRQHWQFASASMIYLHLHKARTLRSASPCVYKTNRCCLRRCFKKQLERRSTGTEHTSLFKCFEKPEWSQIQQKLDSTPQQKLPKNLVYDHLGIQIK